MSRFKNYLNKVKDTSEMHVDMAHLGNFDLTLEYEYDGTLVVGHTPKEILLKLNNKREKPLTAKEETAIRDDLVKKVNNALKDEALFRSLSRGTGKKNEAFPIYPK